MNTSIHIFVGHYGSGKTECAINYAIKQVECGREVAMADLDMRGDAVVREVSKKMQIPCLYCTCPPELMETCKAQKPSLAGEIVPVRMYVRPEYLMD